MIFFTRPLMKPLLLPQLELVRITESHLAQRGSASRVVHDLLHEAFDEAIALNVVHLADLDCTFTQTSLCGEDQALTLTASPDNATHGTGDALVLTIQLAVMQQRKP